MKKIITISIITIICFLLNISNTKAQTLMCKYCRGNRCYLVAQNTEAPAITPGSDASIDEVKDNDNRQIIYNGTNKQKIELIHDEGWLEIDGQWTLPYIENPASCAPHMYVSEYEQLIGIPPFQQTKTTDTFIAISSNETSETIKKYIEPYLVFSTVETFKDEVIYHDEYKLVYQETINYSLNEIATDQLAREIIDNTKNITSDPNENNPLEVESIGCAILSKPILEKLNWAFNIIKYVGSSLAILLGAFDFFKAVLSDEDKATNKAAQKFLKRLIAAALIFLLPLIIQFVLNNIEIEGFNANAPTCGVGVTE